ncbi:MAG: protein kinase, partial [Anaerolineae bacterium]|nr:protein kinase [Anaerolineae bacterium]
MLGLNIPALGPYSQLELARVGDIISQYQGIQAAQQRDVTVKVLHGNSAASPDTQHSLEREAAHLVQLHHPHILPVIDYGQEQGVHYVVTPRPAGETLRQRLYQGGISLTEAITLGGQIAAALAYAHEQGVVHGSLSSEAVLIDAAGHALVTGIGLLGL